jgi:hypothetical protein
VRAADRAEVPMIVGLLILTGLAAVLVLASFWSVRRQRRMFP